MLYLVATPIGNLEDITLRAIATLKTCDYLLCEDTRHSRILLQHYQIHKPLHSFHKFAEAAKEQRVIDDLKTGLSIALISDAGTPGISDPGTRLIQRCILEKIPITSLPGPCALIAALTCSGLETTCFQFYGFLPRKQGELRRILKIILDYEGTTICYESPFRLAKLLEEIYFLTPQRTIVIARELTKKFEEILRGTVKELLEHLQEKNLKGEIVLLISGKSQEEIQIPDLSIEEQIKQCQEEKNLSLQDAIKEVAKVRHVSRRVIYNHIHKKSLD